MYPYIGLVRNFPVTETMDEQNEENKVKAFFHDAYVTFQMDEIDKNDTKRQGMPYYEDETYTTMFNGEIYNEPELVEKLKSRDVTHSIKSQAHLITELFAVYKEETFQHLRGKFSIIIWDKVHSTLWGARDPFGIKPLFYKETAAGLLLTSDKKTIATEIKSQDINKDALQHYLSFQFVPEPFTMTQNIKKIEPGHYFIKKPGEDIRFKQYWQAKFTPVLREKKDWLEQIRTSLYDSVEAHMRGNLPVGSFLSGGIDSTIIVSMAKEFNRNIKTFSVGFEREGFSEVDVAKETADKLDVENISYTVTPEEYVEKLPEIMWHMNDPLADPSCVPLYFVAREASKHVPVVMSGEGSDELFGGYNIYREPESLKIFQSIPGPARNLLGKIADKLPEGVRGKSFLERGTTPLRERYIGNAKMFEENEKQLLLKHYNESISYQQITGKLFNEVANDPLVHQMQYVDIHTWMRGDILLKANQMTMAHGLEVRVPFLDKEVFSIASQLPVDLKIANGTTKNILREAVRGIIPDHVLDRKKLGFPVPMRHWLKDELNSWAKQLIQDSETDELLSKSYVMDLLDAHCQGSGDYSRKIWTILMFMLWHQIFVENKYSFKDTNDYAALNKVPTL